jgi:hypothetical protein
LLQSLPDLGIIFLARVICPDLKFLKARLGCPGISLVFCLDVVIVRFSPFNSFRPLVKALSPLVKVGFIFYREKSSLSILTNFSFMGMFWGSLGRPWVKSERLHGQAPLFLSFRFHLAVRLWSCRVDAFHNAALSPEQVVDRLRRSASFLRQVGCTIGDSGFCGTSNSPDWLFSVSSFPPVKAGRRVPWSSAMS